MDNELDEIMGYQLPYGKRKTNIEKVANKAISMILKNIEDLRDAQVTTEILNVVIKDFLSECKLDELSDEQKKIILYSDEWTRENYYYKDYSYPHKNRCMNCNRIIKGEIYKIIEKIQKGSGKVKERELEFCNEKCYWEYFLDK